MSAEPMALECDLTFILRILPLIPLAAARFLSCGNLLNGTTR